MKNKTLSVDSISFQKLRETIFIQGKSLNFDSALLSPPFHPFNPELTSSVVNKAEESSKYSQMIRAKFFELYSSLPSKQQNLIRLYDSKIRDLEMKRTQLQNIKSVPGREHRVKQLQKIICKKIEELKSFENSTTGVMAEMISLASLYADKYAHN